jgi:hypothetical protein
LFVCSFVCLLTSIRARCTTLCDKVCQWLATGRWFSPYPPVSSTNKTDRYDIIEMFSWVEKSKCINIYFTNVSIIYIRWNFGIFVILLEGEIAIKTSWKTFEEVKGREIKKISVYIIKTIHYHIFYWNNAEFACVIKA